MNNNLQDVYEFKISQMRSRIKYLESENKNSIYKLSYMVNIWIERGWHLTDISEGSGVSLKVVSKARQGENKNYATVEKLYRYTKARLNKNY